MRINPRTILTILGIVIAVAFIVRQTVAGSLTPAAVPAGTMKSLTDIYAPLASTGYDSSSVTASKSGNALQITKCIIRTMTGGTPCP